MSHAPETNSGPSDWKCIVLDFASCSIETLQTLDTFYMNIFSFARWARKKCNITLNLLACGPWWSVLFSGNTYATFLGGKHSSKIVWRFQAENNTAVSCKELFSSFSWYSSYIERSYCFLGIGNKLLIVGLRKYFISLIIIIVVPANRRGAISRP